VIIHPDLPGQRMLNVEELQVVRGRVGLDAQAVGVEVEIVL